MKPSEDIKPITYLKTRSRELVESVTRGGRPVVITQSGEAKVIVQDIRSYERDRATLLMLKLLSQGVREAEAKQTVSHDDLMERLTQKIKSSSA